MSDAPQGDGWWQANDGKWYAPELHPDGSPAEPAAPLVDLEESGGSGRRGRRLVVALVAGLVVLGIGGYLLTSLESGTSGAGAGADSPEAAVRQLVASAGSEDLLGMLGSLDPSEVTPIQHLYTSLARVAPEQVGFGFDEGGGLLDGVAIEVGFADGGAQMTANPDRSDDTVAVVELESLRVEVARTDTVPPALALISTDSEQAVAWSAGEFRPGATISVELRRAGSTTDVTVAVDGEERFDTLDVALDVVTVRRGDRWFVSPGATVVSAVFGLLDLDRPRYGEWSEVLDDPRAGEESPDGAVESMIEAIVDFDIEEGLRFVDPVQDRLAHDAWPAVRGAVDERVLADENARLRPTVTGLELETEEVDGETRVWIESLAVRADDYGRSIELRLDGWCVEVSDDFDRGFGCLDEIIADSIAWELDPIGLGIPQIEDFLPRDPYLVVEQRGDRWFVSPLATLASWTEAVALGVEAEGEVPAGYYGPRFVGATPVLPGAEVTVALTGEPVVVAASVPAASYASVDRDLSWFDRRMLQTDFAHVQILGDEGTQVQVDWRSVEIGESGADAVMSPSEALGRTVAISAFEGRGELRVVMHAIEPAIAHGVGTYDVPLTAGGIGVLAYDVDGPVDLDVSGAVLVGRSYPGSVDVVDGEITDLREVQGNGYLIVRSPGASTAEVTLG